MTKTEKKMQCVSAASRFYKTGEVYDVYTNAVGHHFLKAEDGLFDQVGSTVSKFKQHTGGNMLVPVDS